MAGLTRKGGAEGISGRTHGDRAPFLFRTIRMNKSRECVLNSGGGSVIHIYIILFIFIFLIGKILIILVLIERTGSPTELKTLVKVKVLKALRVRSRALRVLKRVLNPMLRCKPILPPHFQLLPPYSPTYVLSNYFGSSLDILSLLAEPLVNFAGADINLRRAFNKDWGQRCHGRYII